jgi:hypothetical protein
MHPLQRNLTVTEAVKTLYQLHNIIQYGEQKRPTMKKKSTPTIISSQHSGTAKLFTRLPILDLFSDAVSTTETV